MSCEIMLVFRTGLYIRALVCQSLSGLIVRSVAALSLPVMTHSDTCRVRIVAPDARVASLLWLPAASC